MAQGLKKADLQTLAQSKADDAMLLYDNRRFSNAYYLGGYAVEFALKACIAGRIMADTIPDRKFISSIFIHSFPDLVSLAGLSGELRAAQNADPAFHANWGIVAEWGPDIRYEVVDRSTCQFFLNSLIHPDHGVLQWIKRYW